MSASGHERDPAELEPGEVALVLGAAVAPDGSPSPFLAARLDLARELYAAGLVRTLLLSGADRGPGDDQPAVMRDHLFERGVPPERMLTDGGGVDSHASCLRARDVFGLDRLVVVSQSYHLPRALALCRALGVDAVGVGDDTMRVHGFAWRQAVARELLANVKAGFDVVARSGGPRTVR